MVPSLVVINGPVRFARAVSRRQSHAASLLGWKLCEVSHFGTCTQRRCVYRTCPVKSPAAGRWSLDPHHRSKLGTSTINFSKFELGSLSQSGGEMSGDQSSCLKVFVQSLRLLWGSYLICMQPGHNTCSAKLARESYLQQLLQIRSPGSWSLWTDPTAARPGREPSSPTPRGLSSRLQQHDVRQRSRSTSGQGPRAQPPP